MRLIVMACPQASGALFSVCFAYIKNFSSKRMKIQITPVNAEQRAGQPA